MNWRSSLGLLAADIGGVACAGPRHPSAPMPAIGGEIAVYAMQTTSSGFVFKASFPRRGYPVVLSLTEDGRARLISAGGRRPQSMPAGLQDLWADVETGVGGTPAPSLFMVTTSNPQCPTVLAGGQCLAGASPLGPLGREFVLLLFNDPVDRGALGGALATGVRRDAPLSQVARDLQQRLGATAFGVWDR